MALVEIARFTDVYEADLAAAFLASHDIEVSVTERFQTTVDPLMQRALGIRILGREDQLAEARDLLKRAREGEFATDEGDDIPPAASRGYLMGALLFVGAFIFGGTAFWGSSLPRRFPMVSWLGFLLAVTLTAGVFMIVAGGAWYLNQLLLNPP